MKGLNENMITDLIDMLKMANQKGIMVILTLWDFLLLEVQQSKDLLYD